MDKEIRVLLDVRNHLTQALMGFASLNDDKKSAELEELYRLLRKARRNATNLQTHLEHPDIFPYESEI